MMTFCLQQKSNSSQGTLSPYCYFEGKISKMMLHQVTGHAEHQLMADTAKYYGVNVTDAASYLICPTIES